MKTYLKSKAGFSLAELVIAMTISAFVLTASYATVISLAKGSKSMINFSEMNNQTRYAIELFGRDSRMASDVTVANDTTFTTRNSLWDNSSSSYRDYRVTYRFYSAAGTFKRTVTDLATGSVIEDKILLFDVDEFKFTFYSLIDPADPLVSPETTRLLEIKHVQVEAKLQREVLNVTNTNYIISARFMLRNKDVSS